jgi:hypothetical protein
VIDEIETALSEVDLAIDNHTPDYSAPHIDAATKHRLQHLNRLRMLGLRDIKQETEKHALTVERIGEAEAAIATAQRDLLIARVTLDGRIVQRDNALAHKAEFETKLREINDEIRELSMTPAERAARDRRRQKAEAEAARVAAEEAYLNELIPVDKVYSRVTNYFGDTTNWTMTRPGSCTVHIKRRDLAQHEADQAEARAYFARQERDRLADEHVDHCRYERQTIFRSVRERVEYMAKWGLNSPKAKAYQERQREKGLSEDDPPRARR